MFPNLSYPACPIALSASLKPYIEDILAGKDLTSADTEDALRKIMGGEVEAAQVAALLVLLRMKGETPGEIAGCVKGMKSTCVPVNVNGKLLDIVGTGGDGADTINISTASSVLAAASGAKVCKFGNRSVSSMCGSADVLEALGICVDLTADQVESCCNASNIAFMYAPNHYPAMKNVAPVRKALGVRTVFNILGPMTNPASAAHVVIGVFDERLMSVMATALTEVGHVEHGLIVHGCGLDEISPLGSSTVWELKNQAPPGEKRVYKLTEMVISPEDYGIPLCTLEQLKGGDRDTNARLFREALAGGSHTDAKRDAIVMNAGVGLYVYGLASTVGDGISLARETLESGAALQQLEKWIKASKDVVAAAVS